MLYVSAIAYRKPTHKPVNAFDLGSRTILSSDSFHTFNDAMHAATVYALTVKDVTHIEIAHDDEVLAKIRADAYRRYMLSTA